MASPGDGLAFGAGKFLRTPTNLGSAPLYGGTELGSALEIALTVKPLRDVITAEELGGLPIASVHKSWLVTLRAVGLAWDQDLVSAGFPDETTTDASGVPTLNLAGTPGALVTPSKLLYVADAVGSEASFMVYAAVGKGPDGPFGWSASAPREHQVSFIALADDSGRTVISGLLSNLSL